MPPIAVLGQSIVSAIGVADNKKSDGSFQGETNKENDFLKNRCISFRPSSKFTVITVKFQHRCYPGVLNGLLSRNQAQEYVPVCILHFDVYRTLILFLSLFNWRSRITGLDLIK